MTRTREGKSADRHFAAGRFRKAVAFHRLARLAADSPDVVRDSDVITANAVLAAIAYADALTAAYGDASIRRTTPRSRNSCATFSERVCQTLKNAVLPDCSAARTKLPTEQASAHQIRPGRRSIILINSAPGPLTCLRPNKLSRPCVPMSKRDRDECRSDAFVIPVLSSAGSFSVASRRFSIPSGRLAALPKVVAVWLFGSVARFEDSIDSDIDVAVVIDAPAPPQATLPTASVTR